MAGYNQQTAVRFRNGGKPRKLRKDLMILTIDIGNTTVCLGGVERLSEGGYAVRFTERLDSTTGWGVPEYVGGIWSALQEQRLKPSDFEGAILCSVVPYLVATLRESAQRVLGCKPMLITRKLDTGLILDLPEPEKLGWDRVVDAAWAAAHYPLPLVTVDLGTCTTLNVVRRGGIFTGGVIAAGVETGIRALARNTAQLSAVKLKTPDHIIGKNTAECMLSGAVAGTAAMLDGLVQRIEEELGEPVTLVTTGGAARLVEPLLRHAHTHDPEMLTLGLAYLYDRNRAQCPLANEEAE